MGNVTLQVEGMSCGHCVKAVETAVTALVGVENVTVTLADAKVDVAFNAAQVSVEQIKAAIDDQGYDVK